MNSWLTIPMARAFISCEIDNHELISTILNFEKERLGDIAGVRPVPAQNLHFTLAFLGEQREETLSAAATILLDIPVRPEKVTVEGVDAFPSRERPRVVVLRTTRGSDALVALANHIRERLAEKGIWFDRKPFIPHMTVARVSRGSDELMHLIRDEERTRFGDFVMERVALKRSTLLPSGAVYDTLQEGVLK